MALAHILVQWEGLKKSRSDRSREDAKTRAEQALALIDAGEAFDQVAKEGPMDPSASAAATSAGSSGVRWRRSSTRPPSRSHREHTAVVESAHGFHIIKRLK